MKGNIYFSFSLITIEITILNSLSSVALTTTKSPHCCNEGHIVFLKYFLPSSRIPLASCNLGLIHTAV
jgi:hypothetical protein